MTKPKAPTETDLFYCEFDLNYFKLSELESDLADEIRSYKLPHLDYIADNLKDFDFEVQSYDGSVNFELTISSATESGAKALDIFNNHYEEKYRKDLIAYRKYLKNILEKEEKAKALKEEKDAKNLEAQIEAAKELLRNHNEKLD